MPLAFLAVAGSIRAAKSLPLDIRYLQVEWYLNLELGDSTLSIPRTCALWFGLDHR